jgi:hypothetical protein
MCYGFISTGAFFDVEGFCCDVRLVVEAQSIDGKLPKVGWGPGVLKKLLMSESWSLKNDDAEVAGDCATIR